jgi:hypothetical protein
MPIDQRNARSIIRLNGKMVAYAEGGGKTGGKKITLKGLKNIVLAEDGHEFLLGENAAERRRLADQRIRLSPRHWYEALSEKFEIEIRNSDGTSESFKSCFADKGGRLLSNMPVSEPLSWVDFVILSE